SIELELKARGGELKPVEVSVARMEVDGVEHLMSLVADISERKAFQAELERQALYDPLTGLPNRVLFRDRLEHALDRAARNGWTVGVIFLDLDRFKVVNDTFGHLAGDELLAAVARRLRGRMRQQDTFARLGGDEFAGLLESVSGPRGVLPVVDRIVGAFERPFSVAGAEIKASASLGVTVSSENVHSADDLLRFSDMAMYEAKRDLGTHFHMFNSDEDSTETHRFRRETELWRAVEREEFEVHYQPIVRLEDGEILGAEALIRWRHPEEGLLLPAEFIPIAEECGLIAPIESWVVKTVLAQAVRWIEVKGRQDFLMSSNLSARHLRESDFVADLSAELQRSGLPAKNLELELTERMLLTSLSRVNELRELGVRIAVDDLGTGYSSLEYLITMHIDTLKVDRVIVEGLVKDVRNAAVVEAALLIGRRLGLRVIAEGVESEEQAVALRELGYRYGQGFLFSAALPAAEFERLIL
ncbi:MAG TPA: EAL domain-containing protein, partial [Thermoanaerobaculia bacterium]|nr:EAL domain-containing protein [Thermoanaerobaculia bacterium]